MMIIKSFFLFLKRLINNRGNNGMAEIQPAISRRGVINQPDRRASHSGSSTGPQQARFPNRSRKTLRSPLHGAPMSRRWHTGTERQAHFHGPGQKNGDKPGHPCCPPTVKRLPPSVIKSRTRRHHRQDKPPQGARVEPATSLMDRLTREARPADGSTEHSKFCYRRNYQSATQSVRHHLTPNHQTETMRHERKNL